MNERESAGADGKHVRAGQHAPPPDEDDQELEADVDETSRESFPASDPPAWNGMPPGGPRRAKGAQ